MAKSERCHPGVGSKVHETSRFVDGPVPPPVVTDSAIVDRYGTEILPAAAGNLLFALLAFITYYNLLNLSQAWVSAGRFTMGPALLLLHGGAFALALALLWWRDHASVLVLPWHRRRACP